MIYIVEDDANIRELEQYALRSSGFEAECFADGESFLAACQKSLPDLILLDIMLPDRSGMELLQELRARADTCRIPILMVTAKSSEIDIVKCLDCGADDFVTKPFGMLELISRVRAVLRRTKYTCDAERIVIGDIVMDDTSHCVTAAGREIDLAFKEYELLRCFLTQPGRVLSREELMRRVWDTDFSGESRTLDIHIQTLRRKLGDAGHYIHTVRKVGYQLVCNEGQEREM